jgi:hypothetical protein
MISEKSFEFKSLQCRSHSKRNKSQKDDTITSVKVTVIDL